MDYCEDIFNLQLCQTKEKLPFPEDNKRCYQMEKKYSWKE